MKDVEIKAIALVTAAIGVLRRLVELGLHLRARHPYHAGWHYNRPCMAAAKSVSQSR